jgi:hypothetical protein
MTFRIVFWDVLPCKIIVDRRFRGTSQKTVLNIHSICSTPSVSKKQRFGASLCNLTLRLASCKERNTEHAFIISPDDGERSRFRSVVVSRNIRRWTKSKNMILPRSFLLLKQNANLAFRLLVDLLNENFLTRFFLKILYVLHVSQGAGIAQAV